LHYRQRVDARATAAVEPNDGPGGIEPQAVRAIAVLDDPSRRSLYAFVRAQREPVTREAAAERLGISRKLAAFHLDKLVDAGLLVADYAPGTRTRTLGRTPKGYRPSALQVSVAIPQKAHEGLAEILIEAVLATPSAESGAEAALRTAATAGEQAGAATRAQTRGGRVGPERGLTLAEAELRSRGFEPVRESPSCISLGNCPYQPFAARATDLVCGINQQFIAGFLRGLGASGIEAGLEPAPGRCCVVLHR
jgi:predicted ArsR family transcriptional regulator